LRGRIDPPDNVEVIAARIHDPDLQRMSITVGRGAHDTDLSIATCFVLPLGGKTQMWRLRSAATKANSGILYPRHE
jgi:ribosome-binding factor A